jgi:putative membrane protein
MPIHRVIPAGVAVPTQRTSRWASLAASVVLVACVKTQTVERTEYGQPPTASQAAKEPELVPAVREAKIGAPVGQPLGDAEILQIVTTLDSGEIEQAEVARRKATDKQVVAYAEQMFQEHTRARQLAEQLAASSRSVPIQSSLAEDLAAASRGTLQTLETADSDAFDELYIGAQIQQHQEVLDLLENHLIPRADDPSLKLHLQNGRTLVDSHLSKAREVQGLIGRGPS